MRKLWPLLLLIVGGCRPPHASPPTTDAATEREVEESIRRAADAERDAVAAAEE